jgi:exopolyphosphatase/guanosine-5'-triphosphate,3'-diphosphate pyrophosphatase
MAIEKTPDQVMINIKTESDPQLEIWGAMRKNVLFEEVTGRTLSIKEAKTYSQAMA